MNESDEIDDSTLTAFLLGKLPDAERELLEIRLDTSPDLCRRIDDLKVRDELTRLISDAAALESQLAETRWGQSEDENLPSAFPLSTSSSDQTHRANARLCEIRPPDWLTANPRYEVMQLLGMGGMGRVWLARHRVMGRLVALKTMRSSLLAHPHAVERFLREVQAAARLSHPNIAAAYDAEQIEDIYVLAMEYVPGSTLASIAKDHPMSVRDACRAICDAAAGLAHAHAAGLVHRDIKPGNLIRTPSGVVKILDFGLVVCSDGDSSITGDNLVMGTPDFIAPEQANDPRQADARSDLYSLGCTLYFLLSGQPPFPGMSALQKIDHHRSGIVKRIPEVPDELNDIIQRLTRKDPQQRFQSADEVRRALEVWCESPLTPVHTVPVPAPAQPRSRRMWLIGAAALVIAIPLVNRLNRPEPAQSGAAQPEPQSGSPPGPASVSAAPGLSDLAIAPEGGSAVGYAIDGNRLRFDCIQREQQVWLDFLNAEGTVIELQFRLRLNHVTPNAFLKFSFLEPSGQEYNVQLGRDDDAPLALVMEHWSPKQEVCDQQIVGDGFARDWVDVKVVMNRQFVEIWCDGDLQMSTPVSNPGETPVVRRLAIAGRRIDAVLDQLSVVCSSEE